MNILQLITRNAHEDGDTDSNLETIHHKLHMHQITHQSSKQYFHPTIVTKNIVWMFYMHGQVISRRLVGLKPSKQYLFIL